MKNYFHFTLFLTLTFVILFYNNLIYLRRLFLNNLILDIFLYLLDLLNLESHTVISLSLRVTRKMLATPV